MPLVSEFGRQFAKKLLSWACEGTGNKPQITQMTQVRQRQPIRASLATLSRTFDHLDVFVERYVCEPICSSAGPTNLNRIDLRGRAETENLAWIVRRKITAAASAQS